jgi:hypothetical protein
MEKLLFPGGTELCTRYSEKASRTANQVDA